MAILLAAWCVVGIGAPLEREPECVEQCTTFGIGGCGRHDGDVHTTGVVNLVWVDFREHGLVGETERVVSSAIP